MVVLSAAAVDRDEPFDDIMEDMNKWQLWSLRVWAERDSCSWLTGWCMCVWGLA